ncbi:MAG: hypothetical protein ACOCOY_07155 [Prevotella sp.]
MKKIVLTFVAVLTMTSAFAAKTSNSTNEELQAYNMTVNYSKLGDALDLTADQIDAMKDIHKKFCSQMMKSASANNSEKSDLVYKAVGKDLKYMSYILTNKQLEKYKLLLKTTLVNRGLVK